MKKILLLLPCMALTSLPAFATGVGSMQNVRDNDSQFTLDAGYYYQQSSYEGLDNALADDAMEDIVRDAPYLRVNYQFVPNWFISGIYGYENVSNDPDEKALNIDSNLRDTFFGMQLKGKIYDSEQWDIGAFVQYTSHADYNFEGTVQTTDYNVGVKGLKDILVGAMLQKEYQSLDLYGGVFYHNSNADVKGTINSALPIDETMEIDSNFGGMLGANFHVHDKWDINIEYQNRGNHGIDISTTYHFKKPSPITVTKIIEVQVPVTTPVISPNSYEGTINFSEGSNDISKNQRPIIRQLSRFLEDNPDASVLIEGHCDCTGPELENQKLSEERAAAIKSYIVEYYGIEENRIKAEGYGESMPVDTNDTAEGRQNNRRVRVYASKPKK